MRETQTRKDEPIGSINTAYLGCLMLVMALAVGMGIGALLVLALV